MSSACRSLAAQAIDIARDIQEGCDSGGAPDAVDACNSVFYTTEDKLNCSSKASNGDAVRACSSTFYTTADKMDCSEYARSKAHVEKCSGSFYTTADKLKCIGKP